MNKIFCILCHQVTNPLIYTVSYLSSFSENIILIHVDAKSSLEDFQPLAARNVYFVQNRVRVTWGDYSQIASTLNTLSEARQWHFDYLFLLSGDDLPCQSNQAINDFLHSINKKNLVHFQDARNQYVDPEVRVKYRYPEVCYVRNKSLPDKFKVLAFKLFKGLYITDEFRRHASNITRFYKGTNWFSLNHATVNALMRFIDANPWYCQLYQQSFCGDEVFFHTLLKQLGVEDFYQDSEKLNDALRYIDWKTGPDFPRTLDESDLPSIKRSGCLFTRKIAPDIPYDFFARLIGAAQNIAPALSCDTVVNRHRD